MTSSHLLAALLAAATALSAPPRPAQPQLQEGLDRFVLRIQDALAAADAGTYRGLFAATGPEHDALFVDAAYVPGATRVVVKERDRQHLRGSLPGEGYRLMLEIFTEAGRRGRIGTWRTDVRLARPAAGEGGPRPWRIVDQERIAIVEGLYRLELNPAKQFAVRDLVVNSVDFRMQVASGDAFVAETDEGVTALVVRGRGEMRFTPADEAERSQLRLYAGAESLVASFNEAFIRVNPASFAARVSSGSLSERPVDRRALDRGRALFAAHVRQSFSLNLADLSAESWSLSPTGEDCLVEVHTKRFGVLTYARSAGEAEDVTLFNRKARRNISAYASPDKLRTRGRFYNEDDLSDYDVLDYAVNATFTPAREWIEGETTLRLRARAAAVATLQFRLDEDLVVRSVSSPDFGRLMHLRVIGQNNLIVNLPTALYQDDELELTVAYGGRLPPQPLDREAITVDQESQRPQMFEISIPPEPYFVYSNRTHWYPRSPVGDYATATIRITVPAEYDVVATGLEAVGSPMAVEPAGPRGASKSFLFVAAQPVRYLSCVISKFVHVNATAVELPAVGPDQAGAPAAQGEATRGEVALAIQTAPRQQGRGRSMREAAANIIRHYAALAGDAPYPSFSLVLTEALLPGGHSPAYFAVLNQPMPTTPFRWQDDPVSFDNFPAFFLAHEIAHQWWGQGVGWRNYHEQWLSEGFSQYFAALYASHALGDQVFVNLMRQMRRWAIRYSDQGPVFLGYRLGHVRGEGRIFRALVYNKAAVVLHMLRRLVGDEKFFAGIRHFYRDYRFRKAGTDDLRRVMEEESGLSLERFFERWIYGSRLPVVRFTSRVTKSLDPLTPVPSVTLRFEQQGDEVFDLPVTVTLVYASGARRPVAILLADKVTERVVPLEDRLTGVEVNSDHGALAEFVR